MNITFLTEYAVPIIVGICLCVGYIVKNIIPSKDINKFIPLIMGIIGVALNAWMKLNISPEIILAGLFSGLASTGLYEAFKNLISPKKEGEE